MKRTALGKPGVLLLGFFCSHPSPAAAGEGSVPGYGGQLKTRRMTQRRNAKPAPESERARDVQTTVDSAAAVPAKLRRAVESGAYRPPAVIPVAEAAVVVVVAAVMVALFEALAAPFSVAIVAVI